MDFVKRHWEKVLLGLGLLILIGSAAFLGIQIDTLNTETKEAPRRKIKGETVSPADLKPYTTALNVLKEPIQWVSDRDLFGYTKTPDQPTIVTNREEGPDITFVGVQLIPFKMLFKAYSGEGRTFQINMVSRGYTYIVDKVGGPVGDTGYRLTKFEPKTDTVFDPRLNNNRTVDISEITLEHEAEDSIILVLGHEGIQKAPFGLLECDPGWPSPKKPIKVRRGEQFTCNGKTYNVVDISPKQMVIVNTQSEQKQILGRTAPSAVADQDATGK
jgi:hypothetical protein